MKKHIITISGLPGSGKSSTAKGVAKVLGYEHFSSGDFFRKLGLERGSSLEEANFYAEGSKENAIDSKTDAWIRDLGDKKNNFVIDSRTAFHWIPGSYKVFLYLDPHRASERIFSQIQKEGRQNQAGSSVEEVYENTVKRTESERKRFLNFYGINFTDKANFDLFIDTSNDSLEEVIEVIATAYRNWLMVS